MCLVLPDHLASLGAVTTRVTAEGTTTTVTDPNGEEVLVIAETPTHRILVWKKDPS